MNKEEEVLKLFAMIKTLKPYEVIEIKLETDKYGRLSILKKHTEKEFIDFAIFS